jgi:hypothetical protein
MTLSFDSQMLRRLPLWMGVCIAVLWPGSLRAVQEDAPKTGILLVGRSDKEAPLYRWSAVDAKTKKPIVSVEGRWGFAPVPPGDYELRVQKYEVDVPYGMVQVTKDKVTRVEVKSGVELVGRTEKEEPLYRWSLVDAKTKKPVSHVDSRWGFTPVPPGDYELWVKKYEVNIRYAKVQVSKDKATRVEIKTGVEVVGRSDKEPPLLRWLIPRRRNRLHTWTIAGASPRSCRVITR